MKKEDYEICIAGTHRLLFNATEDKPTNILVPTNIAVKPERIELFSKKDKSAPEASQAALRHLLDFPKYVAEPQAGAKLLSLTVFAQVAPLYASLHTGPLPGIHLTGALSIPASIGDILRAVQGPEKWAGDDWHLRRPWVLRARYRVGASGPETSVYRYAGGKLTTLVGEKKRFWAPYAGYAVAFTPDLPNQVRQAVLKVSSLAVPISASAADRQLVVKMAVEDLAYRSPDDVPALRDASPVVRRFVRWLEKGKHAQQWVDAIRANGGGYNCSTAHGERELWISVLALVTLFLDWAARKADLLTEAEAEVLKSQYAVWIHPDGPQSPADGAVDLTQPEVFYDFLLDYLRDNAARVVEEPGHADTAARIHVVNKTTPSLTLPRAVTFKAYAAGREAPGDVDLQRALMEAGVPLRTEGKDTSWRYAFYARGQAPQSQSDKLPCLSLPLTELPHEVLNRLTSLFGDQFGSILPTTGEDTAPEAKIGGKI